MLEGRRHRGIGKMRDILKGEKQVPSAPHVRASAAIWLGRGRFWCLVVRACETPTTAATHGSLCTNGEKLQRTQRGKRWKENGANNGIAVR